MSRELLLPRPTKMSRPSPVGILRLNNDRFFDGATAQPQDRRSAWNAFREKSAERARRIATTSRLLRNLG